MSFLLDTNIIRELCRREPNPGVAAWAKIASRFSLSVITVEEVFFGLARRPNARMSTWMGAFFQRHEC